MRVVLTVLLIGALLGVLVVLGLGVTTMFKGGDPRRSNMLMRTRVLMQAVALILLAMLMMLGKH